MKTTVVCSGGLDSVVLSHLVAREHKLSRIVTFDYGQRHHKEIQSAIACAKRLDVPYHLIDLRAVGAMLSGSALTDEVSVPDGHYEEESMKVTIVPNRNAIMLTIAYGIAAAQNDEAVAAAVHGGDHFIYPDCRPEFTNAFNVMQKAALDGYRDIELYTPFVHKSKADIVTAGAKIDAPFAQTWSCYKGGEMHCGRCGTCVERREAFHLACIDDPTEYTDTEFWIDAIKAKEARDVSDI